MCGREKIKVRGRRGTEGGMDSGEIMCARLLVTRGLLSRESNPIFLSPVCLRCSTFFFSRTEPGVRKEERANGRRNTRNI